MQKNSKRTSKLELAFEALLNDEKDQAEKLLHEFFVETGRGIHEEMLAEDDDVLDNDFDADEANDEIDFEEVFGEDELVDDEDLLTDEPEDDLDAATGDLEDDMVGDDEGLEDEEELDLDDEGLEGEEELDLDTDEGLDGKVDDLEARLAELEAEFAELSGEEGDTDSELDMDGEEGDDFDLDMEDDEDQDMEDMSADEFSSEEDDESFEDEDEELEEMEDYTDEGTNINKKAKATSPMGQYVGESEDIFDELDESILDELTHVTADKAGEVGSAKYAGTEVNVHSPLPQKKVGDRQESAKTGVDVNAGTDGKGRLKTHKGYAKEDHPSFDKIKISNPNKVARRDVSTNGLEHKEKAGDKSAMVNSEKGFGKPQVTSPIGSKELNKKGRI